MFSKQSAICSTVLLAAPSTVLSFSISVPKTHLRSPGKQHHETQGIRSATSLSVIMGGAETPLSEIPQSVFGYEDTVLENVNERAMSLLGQFQEVSGLEQLVHSQDSLAQAASVMSASVDPTQQFVNGENPMASAALSGPPDAQWMPTTAQSHFQTSMEGFMPDSWDHYQTFASSMPDIDSTMQSWETASMPDIDSTMQSWEAMGQFPPLESVFDQTVSQLMADAANAAPAAKTAVAQAATAAANAAPAAKTAVAQAATTAANAAPAAKTAVAQAASNAGLESSKKLISELEKTVSSFDSLASKSGDNLEDVARQLSDQLYQSFATPEGAQAALADAPKYIAKQGDAVVQGALDGAGRIFESSTSRIAAKGAETLQAAKETPIKAIVTNAMHVIEQIAKILLRTTDSLLQKFSGYTFSGHMAHFKTSLTQLVAQTTGSIGTASDKIGSLSMQQIVEFMLKEVIYFVQALSGIFLSLLDALLKSFTGNTVTGHIHQLQLNVNTAVTDTVHHLTTTLHDLGQINVSDAAKLLVSLVAFIAKLLFQLFSAFVIVLSGQGIDDWTIQAAGTIKTELGAMAASAAETGATIAESSINELGVVLLQLLENTSVVLVEGMQALLESLGFLVQNGGSFAGALATDTFQSVTESASFMTANL
eukprot:CAMPEP_0113619882 /NCGR_PEP_ID=MMETSP0017_2-20120614/10111_1 /TAXON_ID=2856 /ORGANISM="Cylindrotheca closterium" /LENGTH=652 /DNA_ID=CAMNT_0000529495 /DNA_START=137 /DNA_END=2095 /DNA_ORIENTATION=+ /assembly_acc=CAM_ASM_000147